MRMREECSNMPVKPSTRRSRSLDKRREASFRKDSNRIIDMQHARAIKYRNATTISLNYRSREKYMG